LPAGASILGIFNWSSHRAAPSLLAGEGLEKCGWRSVMDNVPNGVSAMGQNNDATEHGDLQGQQGGKLKISDAERKRQSTRRKPEALGASETLRRQPYPPPARD
jgi:hypothetical protein